MSCLDLKDLTTAKNIIQHFERSNIRADNILCDVLLKTYGKLGDFKQAFLLWDSIKVLSLLFIIKDSNFAFRVPQFRIVI